MSNANLANAASHSDSFGEFGNHSSGHTTAQVGALSLAALGVVYGDIATSPLYAINEIFLGHGGLAIDPFQVRGAISLVLWAITLLIAVKYLLFVLRADNDGQGGVFALYGLLSKHKRSGQQYLLFFLMIAAGMLFGDGIITPAISVLSAVEGLRVATPALDSLIIPITIGILTGLFCIQRHGTAKVGIFFAPPRYSQHLIRSTACSFSPHCASGRYFSYLAVLCWSSPAERRFMPI
jgi:KUP system potassium uptake protein